MSDWPTSPLTTEMQSSPTRVRKVLISITEVFCASSSNTKAFLQVRPRITSNGTISMSPRFTAISKARRADPLLDRVRDRHGPGREFFYHAAREEAERAAAGDVGAGEDDLRNFALAEQIGGEGGGDPGLAGAGGAKSHDLLGAPEGGEIFGLRGVEGFDRRRVAVVLEFRSLDLDDFCGALMNSGAAAPLSIKLLTHALPPQDESFARRPSGGRAREGGLCKFKGITERALSSTLLEASTWPLFEKDVMQPLPAGFKISNS